MDRLYTKLAELSALLSSSELAHSPAGWITLNTLNAYTGRAVSGNFDSQSQTVVDFKPFTLTHQTTPLKLDDQLLQAIVAIDDKSRQRFQIGSHSVSGRKELVIRLTLSAPRSRIGAAPPQSSTTYILPPTLRPTSPYAVYFCLSHMIKVLTAAGINPRRRGHNAPEYILKLHPFSSLTPSHSCDPLASSGFVVLLVVDLSASVSSGTTWEVDADGMYCSNDVPLPPSHLHSAYTYKMGQLIKAWENDTAPGPPRPSSAPAPHWSRPYSHTPTFFFYCIAELAIKPCRSSRSNTRGGFEKFHDTCKTGNKNTTKQQKHPNPKHQQKQTKTRQVLLEGETGGETE